MKVNMPAHSRNSVKESNLILTEKLHKWVLPALRHARDAMVYTINEEGISFWHHQDMTGVFPYYGNIPEEQLFQVLKDDLQELNDVVEFVAKLTGENE
jgi:hypothetical protein